MGGTTQVRSHDNSDPNTNCESNHNSQHYFTLDRISNITYYSLLNVKCIALETSLIVPNTSRGTLHLTDVRRLA